ncbi:unnamed protein product [Rhizophagus irregularis]|nr:unnamed protein product [Rhizophagus irregularis]
MLDHHRSLLHENISDNDIPSLSTSPAATPPPGARSLSPSVYDSAEEVASSTPAKRDNQALFSSNKRTKSAHSLSLPYKRHAEPSSSSHT